MVDLQPEQDPEPWLNGGASWVLTRIGPFDLDLAEVRRIIEAAPGYDPSRRNKAVDSVAGLPDPLERQRPALRWQTSDGAPT